MKLINMLICILLSLVLLGCATQSPRMNSQSDMTIKRNAAAGYVGSMKFFVGRVARNCRDLLNKNDKYMNNIVDSWIETNDSYVKASELWILTVVTGIAFKHNLEVAKKIKGQIAQSVSEHGDRSANDFLSGNTEENTSACLQFKSLVASGRFDITSKTPLYSHLEELVSAMYN